MSNKNEKREKVLAFSLTCLSSFLIQNEADSLFSLTCGAYNKIGITLQSLQPILNVCGVICVGGFCFQPQLCEHHGASHLGHQLFFRIIIASKGLRAIHETIQSFFCSRAMRNFME